MVHSPKWPLGVASSTVTSYASALVAGGQANAIIRPFWEFNGSWMGWYSKGREAYFASEWRRVVTAARSVTGQQFKFDWNPNIGDDRATVEASYPGDAYVDFIGLDLYGQDWSGNPQNYWMNAQTGLAWHRTFAAAHGKLRSFPEWGDTIRPDGSGGTGDDPGYVTMMSDEIKRSDVSYGCYFEFDAPDGIHKLLGATRFPNSRTTLSNAF